MIFSSVGFNKFENPKQIYIYINTFRLIFAKQLRIEQDSIVNKAHKLMRERQRCQLPVAHLHTVLSMLVVL